jgi:cytochrome c556
MIRSVFAVAMVTAIAIGVSAAIAQQDSIKARKDLMKANGDQAKIGAAMVKGDRPFDLAAVHKIFATFENAAVKIAGALPRQLQVGGQFPGS